MKLLGEREPGALECLGAAPCTSSVSPAIRSPLSLKGCPQRPSVTGIPGIQPDNASLGSRMTEQPTLGGVQEGSLWQGPL